MGLISAIGNSVAANLHALQHDVSGLGASTFLESKYAKLLPFGEVPFANEALKQILRVNENGITRTSLLALHAFDEAIKDAGLNPKMMEQTDTLFVGASTVGGMCLTNELYYDAVQKDNGTEYTNAYEVAATASFLYNRYGMQGKLNTLNTACSSSANAIIYGARLMAQGLVRRAIVGGYDSLSKFTVNGFNALHILSPVPCRPFDAARQGLNLGEGAAFLVLEREEDLAGKPYYATVSGYGITNDAFHHSSLSPEGDGPYLAMQKALEIAELKPAEISAINAHGTGTENNDEVESRAMQKLFGTPPPFSSTKCFTGHTLGAAGAVEAVFSMLQIKHQTLFANLNWQTPISTTGLVPVLKNKAAGLQHVMSNSFGFGGNCSSVIFSKP